MTQTIFLLGVLLAGGVEPKDLDGVLALDRAVGEAVNRKGLLRGLDPWLADSTVLVYGGAPVVVGRPRIQLFLRAQPLLDSLTIHWAPSGGWISVAGDFAATYGVSTITESGAGGQTRSGTYIGCWRLFDGDWHLVGLQLSPVAPPNRTMLPTGSTWTDLPELAPDGPARAMILADREFAALAGRVGAPDAFAEFAAPDAVLAGSGSTPPGRDAIRAALARRPPATWSWTPVAADASRAGDLGFTVGQSLIVPRDGGDGAYGKYLTVWRRGADGTVRFLTDAGNPRPAPR